MTKETKRVSLVVDPLEETVELSIKGRSITIEDFIQDQNGKWVKSLDEESQKMLARFLLDNLLSDLG